MAGVGSNIYPVSVGWSSGGRLWFVFMSDEGYGTFSVWNVVELDPADGSFLSVPVSFGESINDDDAWLHLLNDDFDGFDVLKGAGYL